MSPDEIEGRASPSPAPAHQDKHLARTLEDVSHLFLSKEQARSGTPGDVPQGPASRPDREKDRLKRAVADLTVDNLILKDAVEQLKGLERENELLKRAVADLTLDNLILKDAARGSY